MVDFECHLGPRQLLLGMNGAGKSSIFDVLCLLRDFCIKGDIPDASTPGPRFGASSRTRWQDTAEQTFELDVEGNGGKYQFRLVIDTWGSPERPGVVSETVRFDGKMIFQFENGEAHLFNDRAVNKVQYPFDWHRSALATIVERKDNTILSWFKRWLGSFLCVQPNPWAMRGIAAHEAENPDQHLSNFADWYRHLRQETDDHAFVQDLREVIDGFSSLRLEGAGEGRREIKVRLNGNGADATADGKQEYLLGELSEGQRVLIGLYAVLHFALRGGVTIGFDEPDNFIALREVLPWLSKVFERTEEEHPAQVLIASHHPELLNRLAFKEGLLLDRPDGLRTVARPFADASQPGLSASELITRGWERG